MRLPEYAEKMGICYKAANNHFHRGEIKGAYQLPSGVIIIPDEELVVKRTPYTVTYARVSSSENKDNLETQSNRLRDFCYASGWSVDEEIREIGSGLNDNRKKLRKLLSEKKVTRLLVEHKDRLTRFGYNYIEMLADEIDCEIVVINKVENEKDRLIEDFVSIITSFSAKIYGQRRSKRNTERLIRELETS